MIQKSNMARTISLMRKQNRDSCRSHAQRTESEDETNKFDAKIRKRQEGSVERQ